MDLSKAEFKSGLLKLLFENNFNIGIRNTHEGFRFYLKDFRLHLPKTKESLDLIKDYTANSGWIYQPDTNPSPINGYKVDLIEPTQDPNC